MVSLEAASRSIDASPRISFSAEFLDEDEFISINPHPPPPPERENQGSSNNSKQMEKEKPRNVDFEFLLSSNVSSHSLLTADELFFEGKLLPFWQMQQSEKLKKISLKAKDEFTQVNSINTNVGINNKETAAVNWFIDDDPSPRPPKCTVLWKELLKLKKQRASSSLSSSSSSSSNSSSSSSLADAAANASANVEEGNNKNSHVKRIKKGLERTRSASIRIRPMINLPICSTTQQVKSSTTTNSLPPLFPIKKLQGRFK